MTKDEALKLALEALVMYGERHRATYLLGGAWDAEITLGDKAITALEEAFAQPEHAPPPPQRKPLSAEKVSEICAEWTDENGNTGSFGRRQIARAIEVAHGIKENT